MRRRVPHGARRVLRRGARSRPGGQAAARRPARAGHPGRPRRRGLPAADLHQAGRRPSDRVLRDHRATRRAWLRRGQLQGPVRGDRARTGSEGQPLRYESLGQVPAKRHVQVRRDGAGSELLTEEVLGYEGFSGNETILYHLHSPCRLDAVGEFTPIVREEWVPDANVHRLAAANPVPAGGDPVGGRQLLMFNGDIEGWICKRTTEFEGFYRNGEGDEVLYIHRGSGV